MPESIHPLVQLLRNDPRFKVEAYQFVRDALAYSQEVLEMGTETPTDLTEEEESDVNSPRIEAHLTGQQLCEGIRQYALSEYGLLAKTVLNSWGVHTTSDFGDIVYNLIDIGLMKKSKTDRREDFDDVYDFDTAFRQQFSIERPSR
jgi:uncharacterized repeat protein (TIGR04138 family)